MSDISDEERSHLLEQGRALPPEPGRFPLRPDNGRDIDNAVADLNRIPEDERHRVRRHIVRWAVHDGTTDHLPATWSIHD